MPKVRFEIHFSGHVQGVGFRWNAQQNAKDFDVSGTVQNLRDGRVRLVAEGEKSEIESFVEAIKSTTSGTIRDIQVDIQPATHEFSGFQILRG